MRVHERATVHVYVCTYFGFLKVKVKIFLATENTEYTEKKG